MEEYDLKKERKKVLGYFYVFLLILFFLPMLVLLFLSFYDSNKINISVYVKNHAEELNKYVKGQINITQLSDSDFFSDVTSGCNNDTCFEKFRVGGSGFSTNSCYYGFYYSEKDILHKFEFDDWIIEGKNINSYKVVNSDNGSDNRLELKKIMNHWYFYRECY